MGTTTPAPKTRTLTVVAQDAHVRVGGRILTTTVTVPYEELDPGPMGHRVHVVDYDASTGTLYDPAVVGDAPARTPDRTILGDPAFHAQNVYALVMRTLARFEHALGRRTAWRFPAHQLKVVPHAFEAANAFYSPESESLSFGYYRRDDGLVFTCLSHDVVVHETTHALLDGVRRYFMAPSSPDQAAFHEGYADIIALLSVLNVEPLVAKLVDEKAPGPEPRRSGLVHRSALTEESLLETVLFGIAEEMDAETSGARVNALRRSVRIEPDRRLLATDEYREPHRRGEILVAAVMRTFLDVWSTRLTTLGLVDGDYVDRSRVAEEAATVADQLLTMMVRALDYTPPIHVTFGDFLSAVLTADAEVREDDTRYRLRSKLLSWCGKYGIKPASPSKDGMLPRSDLRLGREGVRFGSLQTDATEMFRLLWANRKNRKELTLDPRAFTQVSSVRPCVRIGPEDGFMVRETVAECVQYLAVTAGELRGLGLRKPVGLDDDYEIALRGGSTLVLDEYGTLKYEINNTLPDPSRPDAIRETQDQIDYLWEQGEFTEGASLAMRLSNLHRLRALDPVLPRVTEVW